MTPQFIYFDLGNVLLNFDHEVACRKIGNLTGLAAEKVREIVFLSPLQTSYESGEIDSAQFCDSLLQQATKKATHAELLHAASDIFWLHGGTHSIVTALRSAGYRLGILSNTCDAHWQFILSQNYGAIQNLFSVFALSFELKSAKPGKRIYQLAAELAGVSPDAIFFTDDRPENVAGARAAGYDAELFTSPIQLHQQLTERGIRLST